MCWASVIGAGCTGENGLDPGNTMSPKIDYLINRFVEGINSRPREPVHPKDAPSSVLVGQPSYYDTYDWRIMPFLDIDWIEPLEQRLGLQIPPVYRSLVTHYVFPAFEFGGLFFFANTPEGTAYYEFRNRLFLDEHMSPKLLSAGYLQFGNPHEGEYNPVCFDMNRASSLDAAIVEIDHEGILCDDEIVVVREIAPALASFIEDALTKAD